MNKVESKTRQRVYDRDGLKCTYCGKQCIPHSEWNSRDKMANVATVDHVIPRSRGGGNRFENLVTACFTCNTQKHRRTPEEYRVWQEARA